MSSGVVHGGVTDAELAEARNLGMELVDLSASINPYGPHRRVAAAAANAVLHRYPEANAGTLASAYAASRKLAPGQVLVGNGSSELIYLVARAVGSGSCAIIGPTFGEYAAAARAAGRAVTELDWHSPRGEASFDELCGLVAQAQAGITFICNPNNPTGRLLSGAEVEALTGAVRAHGGWLVVDEAYMDFAWPNGAASEPAPNRMVLRSLTKLHAIPGLRAGFLLGEEADVARVRTQQPPWSVGAPASAAAQQALAEENFVQWSLQKIANTRTRLRQRLEELGFAVQPSHGNFVLVEVGDAACFRQRLLAHGYVVRDCSSFGLPGSGRIAIPRDDHVEQLIEAMEASRI